MMALRLAGLAPLALSALSTLATLFAATPAAQAADAPAPGCHYVKTAELPLRYVGTDLMPAVDGTINDKPAVMVVDTGSWHTLLTMTGALRGGMTLHFTGQRAAGVGGASRIYSARVHEIGIGSVRVEKHFDMGVIADTASPPDFDVLLGAPFLLETDMMLDLRAKRMVLYRPQDCDKASLYLWQENTVTVPFKYSTREDVNPHFTVKVNGEPVDAVIDSGAGRSMMTQAAARRAGIDVNGPDARRVSGARGIGGGLAQSWSAPVRTVQIGDETIRDAELDIAATSGMGVELILGQDFLRTHRVLFAMRQQKLYIAYLGGDVFTRHGGIEPWLRAEAEAGNADAQYALYRRYRNGQGVARDKTLAAAWLRKAAAAGQPDANLVAARSDMRAGRYEKAIPRLRTALDRLPADRYGPLWLYIARLRTGQSELGRSELEASLKDQDLDDWPYPIARLYLGKLDPAGLLAAAGRYGTSSRRAVCIAGEYIAEWHAALGEDAQARTALAGARTQCAPASAAQDQPQENTPERAQERESENP